MTARKAPAKKTAAKKAAKKTAAKKAAKKTTTARPFKPADIPDDVLVAELIRRGLNASASAAFAETIAYLNAEQLIDDRHDAHVALGSKLAGVIDADGGDTNAALVREFRQTINDLIATPEEEGDDGNETEMERRERLRRGVLDDS